MTKDRAIEVIVEEARTTIDRILKKDRRTMDPLVHAAMMAGVRGIAEREAARFSEATEGQIREVIARHVRKAVADLRPS